MTRLFAAMDGVARFAPRRRLAEMAAFLELLPDPKPRGAPTVVDRKPSRPLPSVAETAAFLHRIGALIEGGVPTSERFDFWKVAGVARNELRNAAVFAWAIDPRGSHALGPAVLDGVVAMLRAEWDRVYADADDDLFPFPSANAASRVRLEVNPFAEIENRVDVAVEGRDSVVHVEIKVDSTERKTGGGQVASYLELARLKANATGRPRWGVVYLAKRRTTLSASGERVLATTWKDVAAAIRKVTAVRRPTIATFALDQFADHISKL